MISTLILGDKDKLETPELSEAMSTLRSRGVNPVTRELTKDLDPSELTKHARVIAVGGDGSLHHVTGALMKLKAHDRKPLGVIPMGTANDFATALGISELSIGDALIGAATSTKMREIDVCSVNGRPFINVATGGPLTKATSDASKGAKSVLGRFAYYLNALTSLSELEGYAMKIESDKWTINEKCLGFAVGNSSLAGGGVPVAPHAKIDDGELDLFLVPEQPLINIPGILSEVLKEQPDLSKLQVEYRRAKRFVLRSEKELQINLDGEPIFDREFVFEVHHKALMLVTP